MRNPLRSPDSSAAGIGRSVSLPVLECGDSRAPMMGRTKTARWRAGVLIAVNVLMIAHLIQWAIVGMTVSPIEPSESMETLEVGVVNAGAIFFLIAIASTLLFGRFFCGWLCHIVALQDLCAWFMTKLGVRPKPFRSRLLVYFPIGLGFYMFVWPSFKRVVLRPILEANAIDWPYWLRPVEPIHQWTSEIMVEDFWATMPPWFIAVPFLIICGFACVYFLGAKGFCTYGCPYAAFFKPIDTLAPVRIRVNDDCHQCGYCTSVCTSNVRVSEEVRDFGMVVDPGCMKTLDCVSACPNDALSLGFGRPALGAKPKGESKASRKAALAKRRGRYDLTLWEEIVAAVLMLWFFYATRGMLDAVPMLLAGGLAAIGAMVALLTFKLLHQANVRLYKFQFKQGGRIRPAGFGLVLLALVFAVGSVWSGHARMMRWRGDLQFNRTVVPPEALIRPEFNPSGEQRERAQIAVEAYRRGDSPRDGGLGWKLDPEHRVRLSYFLSMLDRHDEALSQLRRVIDEGEPTDNFVLQSGQVLLRAMDDQQGEKDMAAHETAKREALLSFYSDALAAHPGLHAIRAELTKSAAAAGDTQRAEALWEVSGFEDDPLFALSRGGAIAFTGNIPEAQAQFEKAADLAGNSEHPAGVLIDIARTALQFGVIDVARELAQRAIDDEHATAMTWVAAAEIASFSGDFETGRARIDHATTMPRFNDHAMLQARAANAILSPSTVEEGQRRLREAYETASDPFERFTIARGMVFAGANLGAPPMIEEGLGLIDEIIVSNPDLPIIEYDLGSLYYQIGLGAEGLSHIESAAERDPTNAMMAQRAGELNNALGHTVKAQSWFEEAERRRAP